MINNTRINSVLCTHKCKPTFAPPCILGPGSNPDPVAKICYSLGRDKKLSRLTIDRGLTGSEEEGKKN